MTGIHLLQFEFVLGIGFVHRIHARLVFEIALGIENLGFQLHKALSVAVLYRHEARQAVVHQSKLLIHQLSLQQMNKNRLSNEILLSRAILAKPYNKSDSSSLFCVQPEIQIDLGRARVVVSRKRWLGNIYITPCYHHNKKENHFFDSAFTCFSNTYDNILSKSVVNYVEQYLIFFVGLPQLTESIFLIQRLLG